MSARKAQRQPKAQQCFELMDPSLPIAGTPAPKPCPWCGVTDVAIDIHQGEHGTRAHAECGHCGAEAPGAWSDSEQYLTSLQLVMEAARLWNDRKGDAS